MNSKLSLKTELEQVLTDLQLDFKDLSRPKFNSVLLDEFITKGWQSQPPVFNEPEDPAAKLDFMKERVGVEVEFGHPSFIGIDLLKFQVASYSGLNKIDVGVYVVATNNFKRIMEEQYEQNWHGSLSYEKVVKYLPHFKSAIQIPIYVIGIDIQHR